MNRRLVPLSWGHLPHLNPSLLNPPAKLNPSHELICSDPVARHDGNVARLKFVKEGDTATWWTLLGQVNWYM